MTIQIQLFKPNPSVATTAQTCKRKIGIRKREVGFHVRVDVFTSIHTRAAHSGEQYSGKKKRKRSKVEEAVKRVVRVTKFLAMSLNKTLYKGRHTNKIGTICS